ncbi:DUF4365 domain-containing protein [Halomonas daqingensis]|uniref:DUF4365 domain-containing protein n=1 Tax=Billgrantia desiderata TaxID=52021 RepID=A0ABS9B719_9GAMM|nr:DUF4365 domain-containing protein [Halomonas desiderata]MCE8043421.1 DUF4365 domain-containing protein [Halomonas desiderata]MCE8047996.1 DUF4365 domain-containing protein [Halomonas desiderata]
MKAKESDRVGRRGVALVMAAFESLGFAFREQAESDYGIDAHAELIDHEEPTGQLLAIQIKAGESYLEERNGNGIVFRTDTNHTDYWLNHALPVIVCVCDVDNDMAYWQSVTMETVSSTGKGWKVILPESQILNATSLPKLRNLLTPIVPKNRYTIASTADVSHGLAKRYSIKVLINGTASKDEIAAIIRQVTSEGAKRRYHRNHLVKGAWGDADAHVVWTFVYPSAEDEANSNHICRSIWIHESLPEAARPMGFNGENIGDGIIADWNEMYSTIGELTATRSQTKEDYLGFVEPRIEEMNRLLISITDLLQARLAGDINEHEFMSKSKEYRSRIETLQDEMAGLDFPPFECHEVDGPLQSLFACMGNVALHYSERGMEMWDERTRHFLTGKQLENAKGYEADFGYELKKVK